jgi:hypothetical protein
MADSIGPRNINESLTRSPSRQFFLAWADTTTPAGKLMLTVFGQVKADSERSNEV